MELIQALIQGLWVILPAYIANGAAPVFGGVKRMDFGKKFQGKDLLGAGKTWEGFLFAVASGALVGLLQIMIWPRLNHFTVTWGFSLPMLNSTSVLILPLFAMIGDLVASFFKRRSGLQRGDSAPLVDQLDFLIFSLPVAFLLLEISVLSVVLILVITPPIHYLFNLIGYYAGFKEVPW